MDDSSQWARVPGGARTNIGREVDDELRFHMETLVEALVAGGMTDAEARAEAERRFGTVSSIRDACLTIDRRRHRRRTWAETLDMTLLDIRVTLRALRRSPAFAVAVLGTLAIGISAATAVFTVIDGVLLRPLPYRHPEQLVAATHDMPSISMPNAGITNGMYLTYRRLAHTLAGIAIYNTGTANAVNASGDAQPERVKAAFVTANLFSLLGVDPVLGRTFTSTEDSTKGPSVMLISDGFWHSHFGGSPNVLGKALVLFGARTEIIGVLPRSFQFPDENTQVWLPYRLDPTAPYLAGFNASAIARLRPGADVASAQRDLSAVLPRAAELYPGITPGVTMKLILEQAKPTPRVIPLRDVLVGDVAGTLWMTAAAVALVLLVTATNAANLLLVRADARRRELSVRAAIGAGAGRLVAHVFTESMLLAGLAAVIAVGAAWGVLRLLVTASPVRVPRLAEVHVDGWTIAFTVVVSTLIAAACSIVPAMRFVRGQVLSGLRDGEGGRGGTAGAARQRTRSVLVAAQLMLALVALAVSGLLFKSFEHARAVRLGFNVDHVATLSVGAPVTRYPKLADAVRFYARLIESVSRIPGVTAAGMTSRLPLGPALSQNPLLVEGTWDRSKPIPPIQLYAAADAGYFRTMQIPLIAGRLFAPVEAQSGFDAVVSQETARVLFGDSTGASIIGRRFQALPDGPFYTVIGVIGSARDTSIFHGPTMAVYMSQSVSSDTITGQFSRTMAVVARTTGDVAATTRSMRQAVRALDPTLATFNVRPMSEIVNASMAHLRFTMVVLGVSAGVTLVLGLLGLYGVIAYVVVLRSRELGLRIALGATPASVSRMLARQGLALAAIGSAAGVALAATLSRFLHSFLFEVRPLDPATLGIAVVAVLSCAVAASWLPARRAGRVDPAVVLRAE